MYTSARFFSTINCAFPLFPTLFSQLGPRERPPSRRTARLGPRAATAAPPPAPPAPHFPVCFPPPNSKLKLLKALPVFESCDAKGRRGVRTPRRFPLLLHAVGAAASRVAAAYSTCAPKTQIMHLFPKNTFSRTLPCGFRSFTRLSPARVHHARPGGVLLKLPDLLGNFAFFRFFFPQSELNYFFYS